MNSKIQSRLNSTLALLFSSSLLFLSGCGKSHESPLGAEAIPLEKGAACGKQGSLSERVKDCARAPDTDFDSWKIVSRSQDYSAYFHAASGIVVAEPNAETPSDFFKARDFCRSIAVGPVLLRIPTDAEFSEALKLGYSNVESGKYSNYWTASPDNENWMKIVYRNGTQYGHGHPGGYTSNFRCFGRVDGSIRGVSLSFQKAGPLSRSACEGLGSWPSSNDEISKVQEWFRTYVDAVCGEGAGSADSVRSSVGCACDIDTGTLCWPTVYFNATMKCSA